MTLNVTEADVICSLRQNPEFTCVPDEYNLEVIRPFIPKLLERVGAIGPDTLASSRSITEVVVGFIQDLLDGNYLKEDEEDFKQRYGLTDDFTSSQGMAPVAPITNALKRLLDAYQRHLIRHDTWLQEEGMTEDEYMLSDSMRLNEESRRLYVAKQLTLGKLLTVQADLLLPESYYLFSWNSNFLD